VVVNAAFGTGRNYRKYEFTTSKYPPSTFQVPTGTVFTSTKLVAFYTYNFV